MNWFSTRVSDDRKYLCGRWLCRWINTRKFKDLYSREITSTWSTLSSDRIRRPTRFGTALNLIFSKLSSQNMRGFDHARFLQGTPGTMTPDLCPKYDENAGGVLPEKLGGDVQHASWNPYPISDQNLWFSLPYFTPGQKLDTLFQTRSRGARRVTWAGDKLLRQVRGNWRKR